MDEDGAWIDTVRKTSAVPSDAKLPTPDDLAYVVMRYTEANRRSWRRVEIVGRLAGLLR